MKKADKKEVGKRIRKLRDYLGLTAKEFAKECYTTSGTLSNWENGKNVPSDSFLYVLADIAGTDKDFLLYGTLKPEYKDNPYVQSINNKVNICWRCGDLFIGEDTHERRYCSECSKKHDEEDKELLDKYLEMKTRIMWRRAVNDMEKQQLNMDDYYDESIYVLELALNDSNKFRSSPEMMAGIELLKNRIKTKTEYPILKYRVDFFLPNLKVVLEVDGRLHDFRVKKDSNRDVAILNELNKGDNGWEIIRIPTKYIKQNVKQLVPAIKAVYAEKQRLRRENGGFIPSHFSKRDSAQQLKVVSDIDTSEAKKDRDNLKEHVKGWNIGEL